MDWNKKKFIDRFVQSVSYHGPSLITLVKDEQGDCEASPVNFLYPKYREGSVGTDYFKHKLQTSCPVGKTSEFLEALDGMHQSYDINKEILCSSTSQEQTEQSADKDDDFHQKIRRFVASKADLLFSMEGRQKLQRGLDYGMHLNQEVLDLYADTPPLETLMELPLHVRHTQLFKCLKEGDIVIGKVSCKRPFGIIVTLAMLEFGCNRDFTDLDIKALCKSSELDSSQMTKEYKDPTDAYVIGDVVRGVIIGVSVEENSILMSLRHSRLPEAQQHLHLGVIDEPDSVLTRLQSNPEGLNYEDHLSKHKGFNNPRNIDTLTDLLGIDTTAPCSLLRCFQRRDCPEADYAESLRKQQSARWSMETTAKGVEHFKAGNYDAAMKYFEHALQIDGENVEALVARGALYANQDKLTAAIKDFRDALVICPSHRNANKYLAATLVEYGIQQEKEGLLTEAVKSFNGALGLDDKQQTAIDHLEKLQRQMKMMEEKKEQTTVRVEKGLKSRFSHVRELILEEQSEAKKKRKRNDRKKKKKMKTLKKKRKKKKTRSKVRHHSKRSSSSSLSSSDSSDGTESSRTDSSDSSEEWVEKESTVQSEKSRQKGQNSKRGLHDGHRSQNSKRDSRDGRLDESRVRACVSPQNNHAHKEREPRQSTSRTEWSPDNDGRKSDNSKSPKHHRAKDEETRRRRYSSSSQSVEGKKYDHREGDWKKGKIEYYVRGENLSPRKRKVSERETHDGAETKGVMYSKRMKSPVTASNPALSPLNQSFLEKELKRIRAHSDKDSEKHSKSAYYSVSKTGSHDSQIKNLNDKSTVLVRNRGSQLCTEERLSARQFKDQSATAVFDDTNSKASNSEAGQLRQLARSLGTRDIVSGSVKGNKSLLVSYEDSSDGDDG